MIDTEHQRTPARAFHAQRPDAGYRLYDHAAGHFLHLSGEGTCTTETNAWLGTSRQAERLAANATARGESWPFSLTPRQDNVREWI